MMIKLKENLKEVLGGRVFFIASAAFCIFLVGIFCYMFCYWVGLNFIADNNPDQFYKSESVELKHYTKSDANSVTTYKLQTIDGKIMKIHDLNIVDQADFPNKSHKAGTTTLVLKKYTTLKENISEIDIFILKRSDIKPRIVITKYKYDE